MPEAGGSNSEVAHPLSEHKKSPRPVDTKCWNRGSCVARPRRYCNRLERLSGSTLDWTSGGIIVRPYEQTSG